MIPWRDLDTLFLDAGNTLVSIDFPWVARELVARGVETHPEELARAEAAGRPVLSQWLGGKTSTEGDDTFRYYVRNVVHRLAGLHGCDERRLEALVDEIAPVLRQRGQAHKLWRLVMPGVPEALARFRALGLRLVVVSNSDGTVEHSLTSLGLRAHFDFVVDSAIVGFEKPDRRIFEHALGRAGGRPEHTLHVGDLVYADVAGARSAGIHPLLLDPFDDWSGVDCARARDLLDLAGTLERARRG